jgi:predicted DNA binding protein
MRSVTFLARQPGGFHSITSAVAEESAFAREKVHQFNVLEDGTAVVLCQIRGDLDRARALFADHPDVLSSSITEGSAGEGLSYMHVRPPESIVALRELPRQHEVFFEFPFEGVRDDKLRVTMVGETNAVLQDALAAVPEAIAVTVERIGPYPPASEDLSALLTDRQREILDVATDLGYYEVPREATHRDIAAAVDLDPGTVSEHMQKIEARVFNSVTG